MCFAVSAIWKFPLPGGNTSLFCSGLNCNGFLFSHYRYPRECQKRVKQGFKIIVCSLAASTHDLSLLYCSSCAKLEKVLSLIPLAWEHPGLTQKGLLSPQSNPGTVSIQQGVLGRRNFKRKNRNQQPPGMTEGIKCQVLSYLQTHAVYGLNQMLQWEKMKK